MPVIRCPKCGQAYDIPGAVAARLTNSIATCHCGEWIAGSKAAVLARMLDPAKIKEVDLQPYRIDGATADARDAAAARPGTTAARSIRIVALGADQSLDTVFTVSDFPLYIGRRGSHVILPETAIKSRHAAIVLRGMDLMLVDGGSAAGTMLDGKRVREAVINDGVHLLQIGSSRLAVEPIDEKGFPVDALPAQEPDDVDRAADTAAPPVEPPAPPPAPSPAVADVTATGAPHASPAPATPPPPPAPPAAAAKVSRSFLVCVEGPLVGQEFEIPPSGLTVGREGHVRVPDEFLSRKHFQVLPDGDGAVRVKDLGSRNGTFLNSAPAQDTVVNSGDEIRAGVNAFRIEHRA